MGRKIASSLETFGERCFELEVNTPVSNPDTLIGNTLPCLHLPNGADTRGNFVFKIPNNFQELVSFSAIIQVAVAGNLYLQNGWTGGPICEFVEPWGIPNKGVIVLLGGEEYPVIASTYNCIDLSLDPFWDLDTLAAGNLVGLSIRRMATDPLDTVEGSAWLIYFNMRYRTRPAPTPSVLLDRIQADAIFT